MKRIFSKALGGFALLALVMMPLFLVNAQALAKVDIDANQAYRLTDSGNVNMGGETVNQNDPVRGDLLIAGGEVVVDSQVQNNLIAAGGAVEINGDIGDDILVAGGVIVVNGDVGDDIRVFGGVIYINSKYVGGDLMVYGGEIHIAKDVMVEGSKIFNEGSEDGSEKNRKGANIFLDEIDNPTSIKDSSISQKWSSYTFPQVKVDTESMQNVSRFFDGIGLVCNVIWLIGGIIAAYVVLRLFPVYRENTLKTMEKEVVVAILVGFVAMIISFFVGLLLLVSIVGIPTLMVLFVLASVAGMLADIYGRYLLGKLIVKDIFKVKQSGIFLNLLVGYVPLSIVLWVLGLLPILGGLISGFITSILFCWALGAIFINKYRALKAK